MLAADGCASSSSNPACCFCGAWAPRAEGVAVAMFGSHWFGHAHLSDERALLLHMLMRRSACTFAIGNLVGGGGPGA
jgi:hypothetical protein